MDLLENVRNLMRRYESLETGGIRDAQLKRRIDSFTRKQGIDNEAQLLGALRRDPELRE